MTDQGTNKTGFARDDELKKEIQGELKASRAVRAREEFETELPDSDRSVDRSAGRAANPSADRTPADRTPAEPVAAPVGAPPAGMTPHGVAVRSELARHLDRTVYPAKRSALLGALHRHQAPDTLLEHVASLPPDEQYPNVQAVVRALGFGVEEPRD